MNDDGGPVLRPIGALGATLIFAAFILGTRFGIEALVHVVAASTDTSVHGAREVVATRPLFGGIAQAVAAAIVVAAARAYYLPGTRLTRSLGLVAVSNETLALSALLGLAMQLPLGELGNAVEHLFPVPLEEKLAIASMLTPTSIVDGFGLVLAVVAIAPIAEELVFRGLLMAGIARGSGIVVGVIISTLLFAVSHGRPTYISVALVGGLVLAIVAYRTESIVPAMVVHAFNNALPVLVPARLFALRGWNVPTEGPTHLAPWLWLPLAIVSVVVLVRLVRTPSPEA